jgi:hypothetical protein
MMKISKATLGIFWALALSTSAQQEAYISQFENSGFIRFAGFSEGSTATVQWASSLTDPARSNWSDFSSVVMTGLFVTTEWPMFFRVLGERDANLVTDVLAYFPFNGNANDESGMMRHGSVSGATLTTNRFGVANAAYSLDGIDDRIFWSDSMADMWFEGRTEFALSIWVRPLSEESTEKKMFFEYGTSRFGLEGRTGLGQQADFWINGNAGSGTVLSTTLDVGAWQHLVLQIDGASKSLYRNGSLVDETPFTDAVSGTVNSKFTIGGRNPTEFTNSEFDDLVIYGRSLTTNDILELYNLSY